jgi:hypothetical protein
MTGLIFSAPIRLSVYRLEHKGQRDEMQLAAECRNERRWGEKDILAAMKLPDGPLAEGGGLIPY